MKNKLHYEPEVCPCCDQTTTYLYGLDRGTVDIVKKISKYIGQKGINVVHPRKEGVLTSTQWNNLSRVRAHGLVAKVENEQGNFCLTRKAHEFLNGSLVPKYAIMSKVEGRQIGYFEAEKFQVKVSDFNVTGEYWEGVNYDIIEGRVIKTL